MDDYISVIVTAYNRKDFLMAALKSTVNQTLDRRFFEIIVVKNFTDAEIDSYIEENGIKNIVMEGTIGKFMDAAIMESQGNIISFLDDDDIFTSDKIKVLVEKFKDNDLCYFHNGATYFRDNIKKPLHRYEFKVDFNMSCISIRKDVLIIYENQLRQISTAPDTFLYLIALEYGRKIENGRQLLTFYRRHGNNTSSLDNIDWLNIYIGNLNNFKLIFKSKKCIKHLAALTSIAKFALYRNNGNTYMPKFHEWIQFSYYSIRLLQVRLFFGVLKTLLTGKVNKIVSKEK